VARSALDEGATVTIAGRNLYRLNEAAMLLGGVATTQIDTGDEAALGTFFANAAPFDHVLISAAQTPTGPIRTLPLADAHAAMESKFWGAYRTARLARIVPGGSLTFVSGFLSERPSASQFFKAPSTPPLKPWHGAWRSNSSRCA